MYSTDELIEAVQRRLRLVQRRGPPPGEFPSSWNAWLAEAARRPGRVVGAPAADLVQVLAARAPLMPPRRLAELTRWQAFSSVWRQHWEAPAPDERGTRLVATGGSAVVHLVLAAFMLWLLLAPPHPEPPPAEGELVVQVEFVGEGTPAETGGPSGPESPSATDAPPSASAMPATALAQPDAAVSPADASPPAEPTPPRAPRVAEAAAPPLPPLEVPVPEVERRDIPTPTPAEQPIAVSEVVAVTPTVEFVLPPTRRSTQPSVQAPDLSAEAPEVAVREIPVPLQARMPAPPELPVGQLASPELPMRTPEVGRRDIPTPLRARALPQVGVATPAPPRLKADAPAVTERSVPMPAQAAGPATPVAAGNGVEGQEGTSQASPASSQAAQSGGAASGRPAALAGQGPRPDPAPGAWPSPRRADDSGGSDVARPGGQSGTPGQPPGLYDSDGRVRLAEPPGSASPNRPPGSVTEEIANLDRAGTWLRRPPTDYEPTTFDKYWRPSETLLEEWVRKGYKEVAIPIPGTNKRIVCGIAFLALGGGCGIVDPNLNEQPATARPPPDIPFKPHLQEGGAAGPPGA
ncbi:hypothetical protein [Lysobacter sp. A3-1-A15]|uniref:hypothetical protein n=1 Tax=Novilysobacter viscosus TaxID=3098602 RepID=UPI002ED8D338